MVPFPLVLLGASTLLGSGALLAAPAVDAQQAPLGATGAAEIRGMVERLRTAGVVELEGRRIVRTDALVALYERSGFAPLWTDRGTLRELVAAIEALRSDGLEPAHYHLAALTAFARSAVPNARSDLLATDALIRVAHDLRFGRAEAVGPTDGASGSPFGGDDPVEDLLRVVGPGRIPAALSALRPSHFIYRGLVGALADLRRIQETGGWGVLQPGPTMRMDSVHPRVPALRRRLARSGDLQVAGNAEDLRFDRELDAAVRRFQHRHGLNEDGAVGPVTLAALNVPVERRIEQVRVNLERARWVTHGLPDTFVAVNVAGARVYFMRHGELVFEERAIVGKAYTRTPVFRASMRYIELNPTWTVPPGIVGEVLARVRREPGYLRGEGMRVIDRSGRAVDPSRVDFSAYTAATFPYVFRQDAGPANPLGRIKFIFPNAHNVYLHDTPARELFRREERLFSHGCIRVEEPLRLAEAVLDDPVRWNQASLAGAIGSGATRRIQLERPLTVLILYWTASTDLHGELHFYRDVYERDAAVLRALDGG
jgi:murein L,D-transpeptidase YcbB/YkuD